MAAEPIRGMSAEGAEREATPMPVQPIEYDNASAEVRAVYDDIKATRRARRQQLLEVFPPTTRARSAAPGTASRR